ncbi:MAG: DUF1015 family protein [Chloroflexi bacterium]|nr:DUF1015 family protein [Chloroflexota bacterium]
MASSTSRPLSRHERQSASNSPEESAALWRSWRESGLLVDDATPAIYLHEGVGENGVTMRGIFAAVPVGEYGPETGVYGHERTLDAPRAGRLALLAATRANLSPILLLRAGDSNTFSAAFTQVSAGVPTTRATAPDGTRIRLWYVASESDAGHALLGWASGAPLIIADGHHRYEAAREYAERYSGPAFTMGLIVEADGAGPTLHATHRILRGYESERFIEALRQNSNVHDVQAISLPEAAERFSEAHLGQYAEFALCDNGEAHLITLATTEQPQPITQRVEDLLRTLLGISAAEIAAGALRYERRVAAAVEASRTEGTITLLLPPERAELVTSMALAQQVMPQKATHFSPKPATGLLFLSHDQNA